MVPGTCPPPDDATAQTLNYALGNLGGKQKSWMVMPTNVPILPPVVPADLTTNPLPFTVRGRGRPRKHPAQPPPPSTSSTAYTLDPGSVSRKRPHSPTAEATAEPHVRRQPDYHLPLSTSTSPQLPNVVTYAPSAAAVLPSPTPSEEATNNLALHHARAAYAPESSLGALYPVTHGHGQAHHEPLRVRPRDSEQGRLEAPATAMSAPSPPVAACTRPDFTRHPSRDHSQVNSPILAHMQSRSPSFGNQANTQMPSPHIPQPSQFHSLPSNRTLPQQQTPFNPPPSSSTGQSPPWYTVKDCLIRLDGFQALNPVSLNHPRDGRRLAVLREATQNQDWTYLTMHQYYCMLTNYRDAVPADLKNSPNLDHALRVLQDVLDSNQALSPTVTFFFANFPFPIQNISQKWPATFKQQLHLFKTFVAQSKNYEHFKQTCERRRCPPLARELATTLSISSPTFQRLVFTAFLRYIWRQVPRNALQARYEAQAVAVLDENQLDYFHSLVQGSTPSQQDQYNEFHNCSSKLIALVEGLEAALREQDFLLADQNTGISPQQQQQQEQQEQQLLQGILQQLPRQPVGPPQLLQQQQQQLPQQTIGHSRMQHQQRQQHPQHAVGHSQMQHQQRRQPVGHPQLQHQQRSSNFTPRSNSETQGSASRSVDPHSAQAAIQQSRGRGLVPPVQGPRSLPPRPAPTQQQQKPKSLLPVSGYQQPNQRIPNPSRFSLHQAHLRSPILCAQSKSSPLYAFHEGYIKHPTRLAESGRSIEQWTFTLTSDEMQMIPPTVRDVMGAPGTRDINERSKIVRLRCVKWRRGEKDPEEHTWAVTDTSWILFSYFSLNGTPLQARKKLHHNKDLPIDITDLLKEGENVLEITVMALSGDTSHLDYLIAIEAVGVLSHESIKNHCMNTNRVSTEEVLQSIKNKLSGSGDDDDDDDDDEEFSVVQSSITIGLRDPFSQAKMCDIPVRSRACAHFDCFDLEIFLGSRPRRGDASVADQWKCPICGSDARPHLLMFDSFNEDVKKQLEAQGRADTRHIIFSQDGSWKPKAEVREGVSDDPPSPVPKRASVPRSSVPLASIPSTHSSVPRTSAPRTSASRSSIPADVEIIDLSD